MKSLHKTLTLIACSISLPLLANQLHCPYPNAIHTIKQGYVTHKTNGITFKAPQHFECLKHISKGTYYYFFATFDNDGNLNCNYIYNASKSNNNPSQSKQNTANAMADTNFTCTVYIQATVAHAKPAKKNWHYNTNTKTWSCPYGNKASVDPKQCLLQIQPTKKPSLQ